MLNAAEELEEGLWLLLRRPVQIWWFEGTHGVETEPRDFSEVRHLDASLGVRCDHLTRLSG